MLEPETMRARIHDQGDRRLGGIRSLIAEAGRARPLGETLAALCRDIAEIAAVDVVSVYVLERDGSDGEMLVLRGNVGFPATAVGSVRLRIGEGLTGLVAECMQPVSLAVGQAVARYRHVDGIGEEEFPAYVGLPVMVAGRIGGVLVLQRREPSELEPAEVALAASLAAPVGYALERAARAASSLRPPLGGQGHGGGVAVGRVSFLPALDSLLLENVPRAGDPARLVALSHESLARELARTERRLSAGEGAQAGQLRALSLLACDRGLRDLMIGACRGAGVTDGLTAVARGLAQSPFRVPGSKDRGWLAERPEEAQDLCLLVAARVVGRPLPPRHAVLVAPRLSGVVALAAIAHDSSAIVVAGDAAASELGVAVARSAGLPLVTGAGDLSAARSGDQLLVDGGSGRLTVDPPASAIAAL